MGKLLEKVRVDRKENSIWILKFVNPKRKVVEKKGEISINPNEFDYLKLHPDIVEFYIHRQGDLIVDALPLPSDRKTKKS